MTIPEWFPQDLKEYIEVEPTQQGRLVRIFIYCYNTSIEQEEVAFRVIRYIMAQPFERTLLSTAWQHYSLMLSQHRRFGEAEVWLRRACEVAEEHRDDEEHLWCNIFSTRGIMAMVSDDYREALRWQQRAYDLAVKLDLPTLKVREANNIAVQLRLMGRYQQALEYLKFVLEELDPDDTTGTRIQAFINIAAVYYLLHEYDKMVYYSLKAVNEIGGPFGKRYNAQAYNLLGIAYMKTGMYEKSMEALLISLRLREKDLAEEPLIPLLNNLGLLYHKTGDTEKGLSYITRALGISRKTGSQYGISMSLNNTGFICMHLDELDKAVACFEESLMLKKQMGDPNGIITVLSNLAEIREEQGELEKAIEYTRQIRDLCEKHALPRTQHVLDLIRLLQKDGSFDEAVAMGQEVIAHAEKNVEIELLEAVYPAVADLLVERAQRTGQPILDDMLHAVELMRKYGRLSSEMAERRTSESLTEIKTKFEIEQAEREREILEKKNEELARTNQQLLDSHRKLESTQDQLIALERRTTALAMAVTTSHEINQPLMVLQANLEMLLADESSTDECIRYVERCLASVERITETIQRFQSSTPFHFEDYSDDTQMVVFEKKREDQ